MEKNDVENKVERLLHQYASAVAAKDEAAFMRLYDRDVRIFDAWESWSYEGAAAWQAAVHAWFESLGSESVKVTFNDVQASGGGDFAVASSIVTYAGMSASGDALRSLQNRITWGIRLSGASPSIVHEHTSAPVGLEDCKAILKR